MRLFLRYSRPRPWHSHDQVRYGRPLILVSKGASPALYVAKNALTEVDYDEDGKNFVRKSLVANYLTVASSGFTKMHVERKLWVWEQRQVEAHRRRYHLAAR